VAFNAKIERTADGSKLLRLTSRQTLPLSSLDKVLRNGVQVQASSLPGGTILAVTWKLSTTDGAIVSSVGEVAPTAAPAPPAPSPTPTPSQSSIFEDTFSGAPGAPADPKKWVLRGDKCDGFTKRSCAKNANVFQDGAGNLVMRVKREPNGWLGGGPFSGAFLGTFQYGSGWPPKNIKSSWAPPYHIEMRALMPNSPGLWTAAWDMNIDRTVAQGRWEIDWAEQRMTLPTTAGCHQHYWVYSTDKNTWDGRLNVSNMAFNWHVYSADVLRDRVEYRVDGKLCGTGPGVSGRFGLLLDHIVGKPGTWGAAGAQPAANDPGPWDMKIDYVKVTAR
jgi:hypothetical protein